MKTSSTPLDELKRQLAQLDALIAEGVLTGTAARGARDELEARVTAQVLGSALKTTTAAPRPSGTIVAGIAAFVLVFSLGGYAWLGNRAGWSVGPGDGAAGDAPPSAADSAQVEAMMARLVEHLKAQPDDAAGWSMLARSYSAQGRYADAVPAYKRALELRPRDAQAMADYADGLAMRNNRSLEGEPEKLILQAVALDPANVKALTLAGTVAFNRADFPSAVGYWQRAVQASDPASDFTRQLQAALSQARERAGQAPTPAVGEAASAPGAVAATTAKAVAGRVSLKAALQGQVAADDTVFIFARAVSGPKMPLAVLRKQVRDLPFDFQLDDSLAMSPVARLSSAAQVIIGARISKSGNPMPAPGDWQALSAPVAVGTRDVRIEIGEPVH